MAVLLRSREPSWVLRHRGHRSTRPLSLTEDFLGDGACPRRVPTEKAEEFAAARVALKDCGAEMRAETGGFSSLHMIVEFGDHRTKAIDGIHEE